MPPLTGVESDAAEQWLYATLSGDSTLTALLASPTAIYAEVAPEGAAFPCVVYAQMAATDVMVVGAHRIFTNALYLVKAVGQGASYGPLKAIAARVDALLHRGAAAATADGTTWGSYRERPFRLAEVSNGIQYRSSGGLYRLFTTS